MDIFFMKKNIIYIFLLLLCVACQSGISFEQIEYKKEFSLKEGKDSPKFYYSANILWANGGTPELNKWLLNSAGIPYIFIYIMERSFIHDLNTAQMAPQSCS